MCVLAGHRVESWGHGGTLADWGLPSWFGWSLSSGRWSRSKPFRVLIGLSFGIGRRKVIRDRAHSR